MGSLVWDSGWAVSVDKMGSDGRPPAGDEMGLSGFLLQYGLYQCGDSLLTEASGVAGALSLALPPGPGARSPGASENLAAAYFPTQLPGQYRQR